MKKLFGFLFLFTLSAFVRTLAEETVFIPTPGLTPGQTMHFEFRPASPDVQVVGVIVVFKRVPPKKEERAPQKDPPAVIPLRKLEQTAFWEKPSGKLGIFEFKIGKPVTKSTFASPPLLAVLSRKF